MAHHHEVDERRRQHARRRAADHGSLGVGQRGAVRVVITAEHDHARVARDPGRRGADLVAQSRNAALGQLDARGQGPSAPERRRGRAGAHADAAAIQRSASTTASCSKALPSVRCTIAMAPKGQSGSAARAAVAVVEIDAPAGAGAAAAATAGARAAGCRRRAAATRGRGSARASDRRRDRTSRDRPRRRAGRDRPAPGWGRPRRATARAAHASVPTASARGGFTRAWAWRCMWIHRASSITSGTAMCMRSISVKKRPISARCQEVARDRLRRRCRAESSHSVVATATYWASSSQTSRSPVMPQAYMNHSRRDAGDPGEPAHAARSGPSRTRAARCRATTTSASEA